MAIPMEVRELVALVQAMAVLVEIQMLPIIQRVVQAMLVPLVQVAIAAIVALVLAVALQEILVHLEIQVAVAMQVVLQH
jgi:hypothetical protein